MNRSFIAVLTPARARLIGMMKIVHMSLEVDDEILSLAAQGAVSDDTFVEMGILDMMERRAIQFALDTGLRAGIPLPSGSKERQERILTALLRLANIGEEDIVTVNRQNNFSYYRDGAEHVADPDDIEEIFPLRSRMLLVNLDEFNHYNLSTIAAFFPRTILFGSNMIQLAFSFGSGEGAVNRMASILHPASADALKTSKWKITQPRAMIATGVFPGFVPV